MKSTEYKPYPTYEDFRCGCKVSWRYYTDRALADEASVAARHNAKIDAAQGYDFGYCSPGTVEWIEQRQMWEVCCP
jgi:hypothetical protein